MVNLKSFLNVAICILLQTDLVFNKDISKKGKNITHNADTNICDNPIEIINDTDTNISTVIFAVVLFRHGERSPSSVYPKDPHRNFTWTGGYGALTQRGALQAYNLGLKLRKRYEQLLPSKGLYSKNEIHVLSSAVERCLMTAQSFLAGFFPPVNDLNQLPIQWQPIAVNSVPVKMDKLISQRAICPKYDEMFKEIYTNPSDELKTFIENNTKLFEYISKHTGKEITSIHKGEQLYDILSIEKNHGLDLPKWTEKVYPEKLLAIAERTMAVLTENKFMKRVKGGYLVTDVLDKMIQKKSNQLKPDRKLFIYSGHDTTIINVLRALDINSQTTNKPEFTSSLYFELHQNSVLNDDFEVKIFYSFNSDSDLKPIKIPNCDSPCSLIKFSKAVELIVIRNYEETCAITKNDFLN